MQETRMREGSPPASKRVIGGPACPRVSMTDWLVSCQHCRGFCEDQCWWSAKHSLCQQPAMDSQLKHRTKDHSRIFKKGFKKQLKETGPVRHRKLKSVVQTHDASVFGFLRSASHAAWGDRNVGGGGGKKETQGKEQIGGRYDKWCWKQ